MNCNKIHELLKTAKLLSYQDVLEEQHGIKAKDCDYLTFAEVALLIRHPDVPASVPLPDGTKFHLPDFMAMTKGGFPLPQLASDSDNIKEALEKYIEKLQDYLEEMEETNEHITRTDARAGS